ncbi:hypothetical protein GCM10025794_36500 [Massilia kyonggiensis]
MRCVFPVPHRAFDYADGQWECCWKMILRAEIQQWDSASLVLVQSRFPDQKVH